jgi:hypothetical protein
MPPGNLRGLARFTVPAVGVPLVKARAGDPVPAAALVVLTVALVLAGGGRGPSRGVAPRRHGYGALQRGSVLEARTS